MKNTKGNCDKKDIEENVFRICAKHLDKSIHKSIYDRKNSSPLEDLASVLNILSNIVASTIYANGLFRKILIQDEELAFLSVDKMTEVIKEILTCLSKNAGDQLGSGEKLH